MNSVVGLFVWEVQYRRRNCCKVRNTIDFMNWLFKEEPSHYSFDALVKEHGTRELMAGGVDGHPSEVAHQMIANEIAPVIDRILAAPPR